MRYEYKILETARPEVTEQQLTNDLGSIGWLLVQIVEWDGKWFYYFARPQPDN